MQRFFIGLGQYDRAILDNMPATIADFSEGLRTILGDEGNRNALIDRVARMVGDAVDRPLSSWDAFSSPERTAESKDALFAALRSALDRPRPADRPGLLGTAIGSLRVDGLLAALPGLRDALAGSAVDWLAAALSGRDRQDGDTGSSAGRRSLACIARAFSEAFVRKAEGSALGELSGMDDALVQRLAAAAGPALASLAARESGSLLRSLDVRGLVVEKIDSLEMIEVERMLLRVIDKELRAVTWFGGILGMLIGLVQSVLFLLR